jgi:hypothetical protein
VILDEPKTSIYGAHVAAPLFSEVGRMAASYERVPPSPGRKALTRPEAPKNERSLSYQRTVLRSGALTLAPATPTEVARAAAGSVRTSGDEQSLPAAISTSAAIEMAVIDPATGKIVIGKVVVPDSNVTGATVASATGSLANPAPTVPPTAILSAYSAPVVNGIPDLSSRAYDLQVRPRAKSTNMALAAGATEHDGIARPPAGSAADMEARTTAPPTTNPAAKPSSRTTKQP